MQFSYAPSILRDFPELSTRAFLIHGLSPEAPSSGPVARFVALARQRLALSLESELLEIQAWRRAFQRMGLKPTQYRCAAEALLRRLRKEGELPVVHPLVDLCNAVSVAFAIPIAAIDLDRVDGSLQVQPASGAERYTSFSGETEHPEPGEIVFADESGRAHARRWANRQSGHSAVRAETRHALIVIEAMHETGNQDIANLAAQLQMALATLWPSAKIVEVPAV